MLEFTLFVHSWLSNSLCRQLVPTAHPLIALQPKAKPRTSGERDAGEKKQTSTTEPPFMDSTCLSHYPCVFLLSGFDFLWKVLVSSGNICFNCLSKSKSKMLHTKNDKQLPGSSYAQGRNPLLNLQFLLPYKKIPLGTTPSHTFT